MPKLRLPNSANIVLSAQTRPQFSVRERQGSEMDVRTIRVIAALVPEHVVVGDKYYVLRPSDERYSCGGCAFDKKDACHFPEEKMRCDIGTVWKQAE